MLGQIIMILLLLGFGFALVYFRDYVKEHDKKIALILGITLVIARVWRGSGYIIDQEYYRVVPLQLCSISTYMALFYFLFNWKQLEPFLFFFAFLGLSSFIDPDVAWGEVRLSYIFGFVVDHLVITLVPLYLVLIRGYKYHAKDILIPFLVVVALLFIVWPINYLWDGANFFYIVKKPVFSDLFNEENFNKYVYDILYIFAFQFAFFVFNLINFSILFGVRKALKEKDVKLITNH